MFGPMLKMAVSAALVVVGVLFVLRERRAARSIAFVPAGLRDMAVRRVRRRMRIALLMVFLGVLTASGHATRPDLNPIRFLIIWSTTALFCVALLLYGLAEARSLRRR